MNRVSGWNIIDTGTDSGYNNMAIDASLLANLDNSSRPTIHFYEWQADCATYGYFVDPFTFLRKDGVEKVGLQLAKRPTGGGIIFHLWDFAFSVAIPSASYLFSENTLENYRFINQAVLNTAKEFMGNSTSASLIVDDFLPKDIHCKRFCMAQPTKYDVIMCGRKIAGAAQRKTKKGFLHQGTISLLFPPIEYLEKVLFPSTKVISAMYENTFPLLGAKASQDDFYSAKKEIQKLLIKHLTSEK